MFLLQAFPLQRGKAPQLHIQDGLGLGFRQVHLLHQVVARLLHVGGVAYDLDHPVDLVQRQQQPLHYVVAVAGALQLVFRPPAYDLLAVLYEQFQAAAQVQDLRLSVHQGQHDAVERGAHGRLSL